MLNLNEQLVHLLGRQIIQGKILPGTLLPKVEVMSEQYAVSRTVVREALKGLSSRKLVISIPKKGTVVCSRNEWQWWDPEVLSWACEGTPDYNFLQQLTEMRLAIEPTSSELAAKNATQEDIKNITTSFQKLEISAANRSESEWAIADYNFHQSIMAASHNELLINLGNLLRNALLQSRQETIKGYINDEKDLFISKEQALILHKNVYLAICKRNSIEARQTMYDLILNINKILEKGKEKFEKEIKMN
ncbi:FadR/GntR family transcriptional regulator [Psychrobacillus sp. NPDC096426]|uniref:FadR/GntR family transcriptional regulator n=1 Tax=Psychrobacillus sp. NPDC096426 TaxID=3364491 RepID=UPI003814E320